MIRKRIWGVSVIVIASANIAWTVSSSWSSCEKCAPRGAAAKAKTLAQAEPLADDGRISVLPLRGEKGEEGLARDAKQRRLAQAPHGRFFNLIHEFEEVFVEGAEGVNNEGLENFFFF